jgi:hypothetical protein
MGFETLCGVLGFVSGWERNLGINECRQQNSRQRSGLTHKNVALFDFKVCRCDEIEEARFRTFHLWVSCECVQSHFGAPHDRQIYENYVTLGERLRRIGLLAYFCQPY